MRLKKAVELAKTDNVHDAVKFIEQKAVYIFPFEYIEKELSELYMQYDQYIDMQKQRKIDGR